MLKEHMIAKGAYHENFTGMLFRDVHKPGRQQNEGCCEEGRER